MLINSVDFFILLVYYNKEIIHSTTEECYLVSFIFVSLSNATPFYFTLISFIFLFWIHLVSIMTVISVCRIRSAFEAFNIICNFPHLKITNVNVFTHYNVNCTYYTFATCTNVSTCKIIFTFNYSDRGKCDKMYSEYWYKLYLT